MDYLDHYKMFPKIKTNPRVPDDEIWVGSPGRCFDIDGEWRHEPGSCPYCAKITNVGKDDPVAEATAKLVEAVGEWHSACHDNIKAVGDGARMIGRDAFEKTVELEVAMDRAYDALMRAKGKGK